MARLICVSGQTRDEDYLSGLDFSDLMRLSKESAFRQKIRGIPATAQPSHLISAF